VAVDGDTCVFCLPHLLWGCFTARHYTPCLHGLGLLTHYATIEYGMNAMVVTNDVLRKQINIVPPRLAAAIPTPLLDSKLFVCSRLVHHLPLLFASSMMVCWTNEFSYATIGGGYANTASG